MIDAAAEVLGLSRWETIQKAVTPPEWVMAKGAPCRVPAAFQTRRLCGNVYACADPARTRASAMQRPVR